MRAGTPLALVMIAAVGGVSGACSTEGLVFDRLEPAAGGGGGVPAIEECGNGEDDDGDGQLDCADPDCPGYACVDAAPPGWIGPFALYDGNPALVPSCPAKFPVPVLNAHADLQYEAALCSACSCSAPVDSYCRADYVWLADSFNCAGNAWIAQIVGDGSSCQTEGFVATSLFYEWTYPVGTCGAAPPQSPTMDPPSWGRAVLGCGFPPLAEAGCATDQVCAPSTMRGFDELCIAHPGVHECPESGYRARRLYHAGMEDSRRCTECSCSFNASYCTGTLVGYTDPACSNPVVASSQEYQCATTSVGFQYYNWISDPLFDATCSAGGGEAQGCVTPKDPITVCCVGEEPLCPSDMVEVPAPLGGSYCVDATEVTNAKYAEFLDASPSSAGQPPECAWNTTYVPTYNWPGDPAHPVSNVDWCDARAYCAWAGKRLCGSIGGGPTPLGGADDPLESQWYAACSRGGELAYPYGQEYSVDYCNQWYGSAPVASRPCCEGGYPGLYDMGGNVLEWEDGCDGASGPGDGCLVRGDSFGVADGDCDGYLAVSRDSSYWEVGFRCCSY